MRIDPNLVRQRPFRTSRQGTTTQPPRRKQKTAHSMSPTSSFPSRRSRGTGALLVCLLVTLAVVSAFRRSLALRSPSSALLSRPRPPHLAHSLRRERQLVPPCVCFGSMSPGIPSDYLTARETRSALNNQHPLTLAPSSAQTRSSSEEEVRAAQHAVRLKIEALEQKIARVEDKVARVEADLDPSEHSTNVRLAGLQNQLAGLQNDLAELRKERNFLLASASQQQGK